VGAVATVGDFDGDGATDIGVYQNSTGLWSVLLTGSGYTVERLLVRPAVALELHDDDREELGRFRLRRGAAVSVGRRSVDHDSRRSQNWNSVNRRELVYSRFLPG